MIDFAPAMRRFQESASTKAAAHARELKVDGHKVDDFSIGEPGFPVPDNVKQAGTVREALVAENELVEQGQVVAILED